MKHITGRQRHQLQVPVPPDKLSDYFFSVLNPTSPAAILPLCPDASTCFNLSSPVTSFDVEELLADLDVSKFLGPVGITPFGLKVTSRLISCQLAGLFNKSLITRILPAQFKLANLCPIVKPGKKDGSLPESYRGISLTCVVSKVLEKLVYAGN